MVRKKLDARVRTLLERSVATGQRSMLVLVGDHGKDQVPNLYQLLSRSSVKARPPVLWCYKKELGFSTHRKKRMKKIKRDKARGLSKGTLGDGADQASDNFELFIESADVSWCYYKDTQRALGQTYGVLVLQDFEALTPNLLARTIETVQGGGLVIFLLRTVKSLRQLYHMSMDVHSRYRTDGSGDVVPRFNERFILTLGKCPNCLVCDDELNILPLSRSALKRLGGGRGEANGDGAFARGEAGEVLTRKSAQDVELEELKASLSETPHVGALVALAKTLDQARAVLTFLEACSERTSKSTVALTAARGRGKSAAIGLCLAGAVSFGYSTVAVTAPEPENLVSVFDFVVRGLKALKYQEHLDYTITYDRGGMTGSSSGATRCVVAVDVHRDHRQTIRYHRPDQTERFASAELVAVDEAAAIPLPMVRSLLAGEDRLTFLSSTVNGYEGTGRALSLKLIKELRDSKGRKGAVDAANAAAGAIAGARINKGKAQVHEQRWAAAAAAAADSQGEGGQLGGMGGALREIVLDSPIRYAMGDAIEGWLNRLLCLDSGSGDAAALRLKGGAPAPLDCELYHVDRDALFSYHKLSEAFLQKMMGLYTSAHYKNTPNDLQMLSDAPAHSVFVLLSPSAENGVEEDDGLPDILAVVQVALEGRISRKAVEAQLARGHRSAGDLIPWTISQQFGDSNFAQLSGARVVRVAVHPSVQSMGYGSRAIELLYHFYNGDMASLSNIGGSDDEEEVAEGDSEDEDLAGDESASEDEENSDRKGIRGEKLTPRKQLPPLLMPLSEVKAPRLDWLGTSFGMTGELHRFWRRAGMSLLYLRQTKNELTGEHSSIMIRALPRRTGFDDAWLPAFAVDSQRRTISLLAGPFKTMSVKVAMSLLDDFDSLGKVRSGSDEANSAIAKRSGSSSNKIDASELKSVLTAHDLKRVEQYGRNLCDHHLVADLLPSVARLYFTGRLGPEARLSSLQAALLCGVGLQFKTIDMLVSELSLPPNQILAMFNKGVRKVSLALNGIIEENEKAAMLGNADMLKAERKAAKMKNVSHQTLEEDAEEGAKAAMAALKQQSSNLPESITHDEDIMQYAIKGTEDEWSSALKEKANSATVQIKSTKGKHPGKRRLNDEDIQREIEGASTPKSGKKLHHKSKSSSKSKKRKSRGD